MEREASLGRGEGEGGKQIIWGSPLPQSTAITRPQHLGEMANSLDRGRDDKKSSVCNQYGIYCCCRVLWYVSKAYTNETNNLINIKVELCLFFFSTLSFCKFNIPEIWAGEVLEILKCNMLGTCFSWWIISFMLRANIFQYWTRSSEYIPPFIFQFRQMKKGTDVLHARYSWCQSKLVDCFGQSKFLPKNSNNLWLVGCAIQSFVRVIVVPK